MHRQQYAPGQVLPGTVYRVVRNLATGGMGSVYDVEDVTVEKRYVLKTLHPQLVSRDDLARRMRDEAKALAKLRLKLDAIVTSPLLRAKQTAEIVAKEIGVSGSAFVEDERAGVDFDAGRLGSILEKYSDSGAVMIVGHEPSFSCIERASPPVSPTVVAQILTSQNIRVAAGALLSASCTTFRVSALLIRSRAPVR